MAKAQTEQGPCDHGVTETDCGRPPQSSPIYTLRGLKVDTHGTNGGVATTTQRLAMSTTLAKRCAFQTNSQEKF